MDTMQERARRCTTHHHACDCREYEQAKAIMDRQDEIGRLKMRVNELEDELHGARQACLKMRELLSGDTGG